jgi:hypothetical protein
MAYKQQPFTQPNAQEWSTTDPVASQERIRVLIIPQNLIAFVLSEERFLLLKCTNRTATSTFLYESPSGDLTIIVHRSFFSCRWTIKMNGAKHTLRKVGKIPYELRKKLPIVPSVCFSDRNLLMCLKSFGREDEFESIVINRNSTSAVGEKGVSNLQMQALPTSVERDSR